MQVIVPVNGEEARFLSEAAARAGMDLPNYLYRVAVDQANADWQRQGGPGNVAVPQLRWVRR